MIEVDNWLLKEGLNSKIIMQVHDELVLEVPEAEEEIIREGLIKLMTEVVSLNIPLLVDLGSGDNWDEAH
jgi:DNA polymerase-1